MENSPVHSLNNLVSSSLGQRLQQRLVKPAGVINTQQLHCHYQATQNTAGQLIQRLALPEQVKFRYGSGVLQPTATIGSFQRKRTESADIFKGQFQPTFSVYPARGETVQRSIQNQSEGFQNSKEIKPTLLKVTKQNTFKSQASSVEDKPQSSFSTPIVQTSINTKLAEPQSRVQKQQQLQIDRKATFAEVNALSSNQSHSEQRQIETHSHVNSTLETSEASSPAYPQKSSSLRISQKTTTSVVNVNGVRRESESKSSSSEDLPLAKSINPSSVSTVQPKAEAVNFNQSGSSKIAFQSKSSQQPNQDLPLAPATSPLLVNKVQPKAYASCCFCKDKGKG